MPPLNSSVVPLSAMKVPVSVPPPSRSSVPLCPSMMPLLLSVASNEEVVPLDIFSVPALLNVSLLPPKVALFCRSQTAPLSLLIAALKSSRPTVLVRVAKLFSVRLAKVLPTPLSEVFPRRSVSPAPLIVPPDHSN